MTEISTNVTVLQQRITELEEENERLRKRNAELEHAGCATPENPKSRPSVQTEEEKKKSRQEVLEKIQSREINFNDLKPEWQDDIDLVCATFAAFPRNSVVGKFDQSLKIRLSLGCKQVKYSELPYHLVANEAVLVAALASQGGPKSWEKDVPIWLRNKPDVICAALDYGILKFEDVPEELHLSHPRIAYIGIVKDKISADDVECVDDTTWMTAVKRGEIQFRKLPNHLQSDLDFARVLIQEPTGVDMVGAILRRVTILRHDETIWLSLLSVACNESSLAPHEFQCLLEELAPIELLSNRDFMATVCVRHAEAISLVDNSLETDAEFLAQVVRSNVYVLKYLSHEAQAAHSHLIFEVLPKMSEEDHSRLLYHAEEMIAPSQWEDIDFARCWIKAGFSFPRRVVDTATLWKWGEDRTVSFTNITMNENFFFVPRKWLYDEDFMLDVVDQCKNMSLKMCGDVHDYSNSARVGIAVFATSRDFTRKQMLAFHIEGNDETIKVIARYIRRELEAYQAFSDCILGSMLSTKTFETTGMPLSLLNQGPETSLVYKRKLAEYLDVPTGKYLRHLRQADQNIRHAVAPWKPDLS